MASIIHWNHRTRYTPKNIFNWHRVVTTTSGKGKTYAGKLLLARLMMERARKEQSLLDKVEVLQMMTLHQLELKNREEWIERKQYERASLLAIILEESI
jgi:hypothetical protein